MRQSTRNELETSWGSAKTWQSVRHPRGSPWPSRANPGPAPTTRSRPHVPLHRPHQLRALRDSGALPGPPQGHRTGPRVGSRKDLEELPAVSRPPRWAAPHLDAWERVSILGPRSPGQRMSAVVRGGPSQLKRHMYCLRSATVHRTGWLTQWSHQRRLQNTAGNSG